MENKLSINILVREEEMDGEKVIIVNNEETGISDFGDTLDEAISNFRKSMSMFLEEYPEKRELLIQKENKPLLISKIFL